MRNFTSIFDPSSFEALRSAFETEQHNRNSKTCIPSMMVGQCNELDNTPIPPVTFAVRVKNATFGSMFDHNRPSFEKEQLIKQKKTWGADK